MEYYGSCNAGEFVTVYPKNGAQAEAKMVVAGDYAFDFADGREIVIHTGRAANHYFMTLSDAYKNVFVSQSEIATLQFIYNQYSSAVV